MEKKFYSLRLNELKQTVSQLQVFLRKHKAQRSLSQLKSLINKINNLITELKSFFELGYLRQIIKPAAIALGLSFGITANAQNFAPAVENPFGFVPELEFLMTSFADLDNDGDLDILAISYGYDGTNETTNFVYLENNGTSSNALFNSRMSTPFGLDTPLEGVSFPVLADFDDDGDADLLVFGYYGANLFFENTGTASSPQFASPQINAFGLNNLPDYAYFFFPTAADLDNDGDTDLLLGFYGYDYDTETEINQLLFVKNIGTSSVPNFTTPEINPFGLSTSGYFSLPVLGDVDNDGDLDLFVSGYSYELEDSIIEYFENTGSASSPSFVQQPEGNITGFGDYLAIAQFADIDTDGDDDLFVHINQNGGVWQFYENLNIETNIGTDIINEPISVYPNPAENSFEIQYNGNIKSVELSDVSGRVVYYANTSNKQIDISNLSKGYYLLKITNSDGAIAIRKILKE